MIKRILFASLFFTILVSSNAIFAFNPKDPIAWEQSNPFPPSVMTNTGTYTTVFTFKNQTGYELVHPLIIQKDPGASVGEFTYVDNCSNHLLAIGQSCVVTVDLTPVTDGQKKLTLTIAGWSKAEVPLPSISTMASGNADRIITGSFTTTNWPSSLAVGQAQPYSFTFLNMSSTTTATGVSISCGSNIANCTNTCGSSLAPNTHCTVTGNFTPTSAMVGGASQTISASFAYNQGSTVTIASPSVQITPTSNIVGAFSATNWPASIKKNTTLALTPNIFTFTNTGNTTATGVSVSCSSNISSCINTCGSTLGIGDSCTVSGTFNAGASPDTQVMSASFAYSQGSTVTASSLPIQVTPDSGFIGVATPNATTVTQGVGTTITFTYTNYDSGSVVIPTTGSFNSAITGGSAASFSNITNNCSGQTLTLSNPSCTVTGTYIDNTSPPTNTATLTGTLTPNAPASPASAASTLTNSAPPTVGSDYLMWTLPASGISYPVYVYQGGAQVNYIPSSATQAFAGAYPNGVEGKTFSLYYQSSGTYKTCNVVFTSSGTLDSATTCPGTVINPPTNSATANSNVYTLATGAAAFPTDTGTPTPAPTTPYYSQRGIVFENNTGYYAIHVQGTCVDLSACSSGYSAIIPNGGSATISVANGQLGSSAFYVTGYCTGSSSAACPNTASGGSWVHTGGWNDNADNGGVPYATKVEFTFLTPPGATNLDVSAVDGYNMAVQLYPISTGSAGPNVGDASGAYCTYTVPPENSNALGAGLYRPFSSSGGTPIARIFNAANDGASLVTMCQNSSVTPSWPLSVSNNTNFTGCMSPCTYATKLFPNTASQAQYCCSGAYDTPETCTAPISSSYVQNVDSKFQTIYSFAYGDAGADFSCEGSNSYVVSFIPSNGIAPPPP